MAITTTREKTSMSIRKIMVFIEETYIEGEKEVLQPTRIAAAAAVIQNPMTGRSVQDLSPIINTYRQPLGELLPRRAIKALSIMREQVQSFGKGVIMGLAGELLDPHASKNLSNSL
jgi:hypothetical protein